MRCAKITTSISVQGQIMSAYGGALFAFLLWFEVLFFSIALFWGTCQISTLSSVESSLG
jgi:hypothetical protein